MIRICARKQLQALWPCGHGVGSLFGRPESSGRRCYSAANGEEVLKEADVVVVGGGVIGSSIAYHLARRQVGLVILLERHQIGSGLSSYANSLLTYYHYSAPNFKRLVSYSIDLYSRLMAENLPDGYFSQCGTLRLATTDGHVSEYKRYLSRLESRAELLQPDQVLSKCPLLNPAFFKCALYTSADGQVDAQLLCKVLAENARVAGAHLYENCPNVKTTYAGDGHWNVLTSNGSIRAANVVVAAGLHGKEAVMDTLKYELPLQFVLHQKFSTTESPALQRSDSCMPVIEDPSGGYYIRQERNRFVFGAFEKEEDVRLLSSWADQATGSDLLEPDFEIVKSQYKRACQLLPALDEVSVESCQSEALCVTPDGFPLVGPVVSHENYWIALGFADNLAYAGGIGKYVADWIVDGEPPFDLSEAEPGRFQDWTDQRYSVAKARESYSLRFGQSQPISERPAGRPTTRVSGIFGALVREGAHMQQVSGWENPSYFGKQREEGIKNEYRLATEACGLIDQSSLSMTEIRGSGAHQFLEYMLVKEVPQAAAVNYSCLLTTKGRIVSQVKVIPNGNQGRQYLLVGGSSQEPINMRWLSYNALQKKFHVEVTNVSQFLAAVALVGPLARHVLSRLTKSGLSEQDFPHMTLKLLRLAGVPVIVCHTSQTGELGFELYHSRADTLRIYEALMEAGRDFGIGNIGWDAVNVLRMEKGIKLAGLELTLDHDIVEAGLGDTVVMDKADFLGRSAVRLLLTKPPDRRLLLLQLDRFEDETFSYLGEKVICRDQTVGYVTSGCFSYLCKGALIFAYVDSTANRHELQVEVAGERFTATYLPEAPAQPYFRRYK